MSLLKLEHNITNAYREEGKNWLQQLTSVITILANRWCLSDIKPVASMSWHYVALALQNKKVPVVLKIGCQGSIIADEHQALLHFDGQGMIEVIEYADKEHALLLTQAIPGLALKQILINKQEVISIYASVLKKLIKQKTNAYPFTHVKDWCADLAKLSIDLIPKEFINTAQQLTEILLATNIDEYICHGDLHLENIIQQRNTWLAIDPKGIISERAFEAAAFDLLTPAEINAAEANEQLILQRTEELANAVEIKQTRLLAWIYVRVMLAIQWFLEDAGDATQMLRLAKLLYPIIIKSDLFNKNKKRY